MNLPRLIAGGAYELLEHIGRGGMADVYRARVDLKRFDFELLLEIQRDRRQRRQAASGPRAVPLRDDAALAEIRARCDQRGVRYPAADVAIKVQRPSPEPGAGRRFEDEWLALVGVAHPNLVEVYGGGLDPELGSRYFAMERLPSIASVEDLVGRPPEEQLDVVRQAALGLGALHERGIVHRDVKPENLACCPADAGWSVKVTDLGVAKDLERSLTLTGANALIGTPYYLAPEVAGHGADASPQADLYGLGATLYTYVCGHPPYQGERLYAMLRKLWQREKPPPPVRPGGNAPPAAVARLIRRLMAPDPADRPPGIPGALAEIDEALAGLSADGPLASSSGLWPSLAGVAIGTPAQESLRVLIVDTDRLHRRLLVKLLRQADLDVCEVGSGAEALLAIGAGRIDLVVSALALPDLDGLQLLQALDRDGARLPVILMADEAGLPAVAEARARGAAAVLVKPVPLLELVGLIEQARHPRP